MIGTDCRVMYVRRSNRYTDISVCDFIYNMKKKSILLLMIYINKKEN